MSQFDRSSFMKERHLFAKKQQGLYENKFGEKKDYSSFLRNESPLTRKIVTYEVSYQLNYRGETDSFIINPRTLKIIGYQGDEQAIKGRVMNTIKDSKGDNSGDHLQPGTIDMIDKNLSVDEPRGMEKKEYTPTRQEINDVISHGVHIKDIDKTITFKNKKGREGVQRLDMRHF